MIFDTILLKFADRYPSRLATVLPADKALHVIAGLAIGAITALVVPHWASAAVAGIIASTSKELYDAARRKPFDRADIVATVIGAALATPIYILR